MAMDSWTQLQGNRSFNGIQLQQAVSLGQFTAIDVIPQTQDCLECQQITNYVNVNPVLGGNKLVLKGQLTSSITYHAISGCYFQSDADPEVVCPINGTETYYNTTGKDIWESGDIVYKLVGSDYVPLGTESIDFGPVLSYTRNTIRKWIQLNNTTGSVTFLGNCESAKPTITIDTIGKIQGLEALVDMTSSDVLTSDISITITFNGVSSGATHTADILYLATSGISQSDTFAFYAEAYGFLDSEDVTTYVETWTPVDDNNYIYDVG